MSVNNMLVAFLGAGGLVAFYLSRQTQLQRYAPAQSEPAATWGMARLQQYLPQPNQQARAGSPLGALAQNIPSIIGLLSGGSPAPVDPYQVRTNQFGDLATGFATILNGGQPMSNAHTLNIGQRLKSNLMRDFQLSSAQAAGIVGNLAYESAGFKTLQEMRPTVAGSRGGYGYAQWTGPRRRAFEAWAGGQGLDPASYAANYGFLSHELRTTERRSLHALRGQSTAAEAARSFSAKFLRPGVPATDRRVALANQYA